MPKAKLEFTLPDESEEYRLANNASNYYCCLWDISQYIRDYFKHGGKTADEVLEIIQEDICELKLEG